MTGITLTSGHRQYRLASWRPIVWKRPEPSFPTPVRRAPDLAASGAFYSAVARHLERFAWLREPDSFDLNQVESELRELAGAGQA